METENQNENQDIMDGLQALIGEQIEKYHEEKIRKDQGQEPNPGPGRGMKTGYKKKFPQALLQQYLHLN